MNIQKSDGSSAFPTMGYSSGMSLRDHFAGLAMQAMWSNSDFIETLSQLADNPKNTKDYVAHAAYTAADAMIAERAKNYE